MAMHGSISEFKPGGKEAWSTYTERLGYYFEANGVQDAGKKRSILLAVCGPATFKLIKSLTDSLETKSFEDICSLVKSYYEPVPSPIVQRYKFNTRSRAPGEGVAAYVTALRELAEHCLYGSSLQEMLRDRLVCGVNHETIQKRLLAEKDLTYDTAYTLALAIETAEKDTKNLKPSAAGAGDASQHQVLYNHGKGAKLPTSTPAQGLGKAQGADKACYRCGAGNHLAPACRHKDTECSYCKKKGHLTRVCRSKKKSQGKPPEASGKS